MAALFTGGDGVEVHKLAKKTKNKKNKANIQPS